MRVISGEGEWACQEELVYQTLKLLIFTINIGYYKYDLHEMGRCIITHFLFWYDQGHSHKRVITKERTVKIMY